MKHLTECHYRGRGTTPVRILGYFNGENETLDELGVLFLHSKEDAMKYGEDVSKYFSFDCPKVGIMGYRIKEDVLAIAINFAYCRTLLLLHLGVGIPACLANGRAYAISPKGEKEFQYNTAYWKSQDASAGIKVMKPLDELNLEEHEAKGILNALEAYVGGGKYQYEPVLIQKQVDKEKPLWNSTVEYLKDIAREIA